MYVCIQSNVGATSFFGCIGTDHFGAQLKQCAAADGVNAFYKEDPTTPTGQVRGDVD